MAARTRSKVAGSPKSPEIGQAPGEAPEHRLVHRLAGGLDRLAGVLAQLLVGPVVDHHHRAGEQAAALQPVQRTEGHHLGQVAADPEHDQHVGCCRSPFVGEWFPWFLTSPVSFLSS